jgi:hypothetical protein
VSPACLQTLSLPRTPHPMGGLTSSVSGSTEIPHPPSPGAPAVPQEAPGSSTPPPPTLTAQEQSAEPLLDQAREKIARGDHLKALEDLVQAIRVTQGEAAILGALDEAKVLAAEARQAGSQRSAEMTTTQLKDLLTGDGSVLQESGQEGLIRESMEYGSSVICRRCHAVVAEHRKEAHSTMWCPALDGPDADDA